MKTAISIPDEVYEDAERLARRTKKSRSRLYGDSLIVSVDKALLTERAGKLPLSHLNLVLAGIDTVLGK